VTVSGIAGDELPSCCLPTENTSPDEAIIPSVTGQPSTPSVQPVETSTADCCD
jgi:hypothetical protein